MLSMRGVYKEPCLEQFIDRIDTLNPSETARAARWNKTINITLQVKPCRAIFFPTEPRGTIATESSTAFALRA